MKKLPRYFLLLAASVLGGLTMLRAAQSWRLDSHLDHVAGAWVALALDLRHGLFYRAPLSPAGYGGTRFFPLYFCLHAAFMKVAGWRAAGYFLSAVSVVLLLVGVYVLLRRLGTSVWLAGAGVLATLAGSSAQDSLLGIREDGMAAMFSVWGIAVCLGREHSSRRIWLAAMFFSLAFATKESSVAAPAALFLSFAVARNFRAAVRLLIATTAGFTLVLSTMYLASSGRAFAAFRYTLATGSNLASLLSSPVTMAQTMHGYFTETVLLVLALAAFVLSLAHKTLRVPSLWFLCTLAVTLVIFSSEGTAGNHLLELHVACVVTFAAWASDIGFTDPAITTLAATCLLACAELFGQHAALDGVPVRQQLQEIMQTIGPADKPILSDNPLVPIAAGQRPYVLDAFMLRVIREHDPSFSDELWQKLRERQFAAVVLIDNPDTGQGDDTYSNYHFGEGFVEVMRQNYPVAKSVGEHFLFLPQTVAQSQ